MDKLMGLIAGMKVPPIEEPVVKEKTLNEFFSNKTLEGRVMEISGEDAIIRFPGKTLPVKLQAPLKEGDVISVELKDISGDKFILGLVNKKNTDSYIIATERAPENLPALLNMKETPETLSLIKEAMKYELPLDKEFLTKALNILKEAGGDINKDMKLITFMKMNDLPLSAEVFRLLKNFSTKPFPEKEIETLRKELMLLKNNGEESTPVKDNGEKLLKSLDNLYIKSGPEKEIAGQELKNLIKTLYTPAEKEILEKSGLKNFSPRPEETEPGELKEGAGKKGEALQNSPPAFTEEPEGLSLKLKEFVSHLEKDGEIPENTLNLLKNFKALLSGVKEDIMNLPEQIKKDSGILEGKIKDFVKLPEGLRNPLTEQDIKDMTKLLEQIKKELNLTDHKDIKNIVKLLKELELHITENKLTGKLPERAAEEILKNKEIITKNPEIPSEKQRVEEKVLQEKPLHNIMESKDGKVPLPLKDEQNPDIMKDHKSILLQSEEEIKRNMIKLVKTTLESLDTLHVLAKNKNPGSPDENFIFLALPFLVDGQLKRSEMKIYKKNTSQKKKETGDLKIEIFLETVNIGPVGIEIKSRKSNTVDFKFTLTKGEAKKLFEENLPELVEMLKKNNFTPSCIMFCVGDVIFPSPGLMPEIKEKSEKSLKIIDAKV